jgi:hypothetical protein
MELSKRIYTADTLGIKHSTVNMAQAVVLS